MLNWKTSNYATRADSPLGNISIYTNLMSPRGHTKYCISMEGRRIEDRFDSEEEAKEFAEITLIATLETRIKQYQEFLGELPTRVNS